MGEVSTIGLDLAKEVMPPAQSCFESDCAGLLSCNSLQLKRRAELRWKLARLRIIGAASFPAWVMKFSLFHHPM
jgi:hypothetical protein